MDAANEEKEPILNDLATNGQSRATFCRDRGFPLFALLFQMHLLWFYSLVVSFRFYLHDSLVTIRRETNLDFQQLQELCHEAYILDIIGLDNASCQKMDISISAVKKTG